MCPINYIKTRIIAVILCGGAGSRLWPVSKQTNPKPLILLENGNSLLQQTLLLLTGLACIHEVLFVTKGEWLQKIKNQVQDLKLPNLTYSFILEPFGKNTAAAICLAMAWIEKSYKSDNNTKLLILPVDQYIANENNFHHHVKEALPIAQQGKIVLLGVRPTGPETGYDYIQAVNHDVIQLIRKPSIAQAQAMVALSNFFWNIGIVICELKVMLTALHQKCSDILIPSQRCIADGKTISGQVSYVYINHEQMLKIPEYPIEYSLIEKIDNASVIVCDMEWRDKGNWLSFTHAMHTDINGNRTEGNTFLQDCSNLIVKNHHRLISVLGASNLIIVDTEDALLIADQSQAHSVKHLCNKMTVQDKPKTLTQEELIVHQSWGFYRILRHEGNLKVKQLVIYPHSSLNLQSHCHSNEHWIVVQGVARVRKDDKIMDLSVNQAIFIQANQRHQLTNKQDSLLIVVEIQVGSYLGEDDIMCYAQAYSA